MILDKIAAVAKKRVYNAKSEISFENIKKTALTIETKQRCLFEKALKKNNLAFICEVKKASPSKGIISENFPYLKTAKEYESADADAISVLTEPEFFKGSDNYLTEIKKEVDIPVLRKDFIIDPYQIYQSKIIGADAILLICALLDTKTIEQ
jgi:indole-3-glycerol phosphate synthase